MIKDRILVGSLAGMIGSLFKDMPNFFFYKLGLVKYLYAHLAASAHLDEAGIYTPLGLIIGFLADTITGGAIGVATILFLDKYGTRYWWYKGCIIANTIWLFGLGVVLNLNAVTFAPRDPAFRFTSFFDHILFGLVTVYLIYKWDRLREKS
ncbi:MAG: hypothetical protein ACM3YE_00660 [Bacteroidota bacterium]